MNGEIVETSAGEFLAKQLDARGWTRAEFAEILGRPPQFVSEIITGKKEMTRESASQIAAAFGNSPELWLNIQDKYFLWRQRQNAQTQSELDDVRLRARLKELAPMAVLRKRGLIAETTVSGQVEQLKDLFELDDIYDEPSFSMAARRSNQAARVSSAQLTWLACVRRKARKVETGPYDRQACAELAEHLSRRVAKPYNFRVLPEWLAAVGVRLLYIEAFPSSKLDGCSFMLDDRPVIGLSGRGRRLDKVLFTLLHEVAHVVLGHVDDVGIVDDAEDQHTLGEEQSADEVAGKWILPDGLAAIPDRISSDWINDVAATKGVHPIVIIGRLQNLGKLTWRTSLVKGAPSVTEHLATW